MPDVTPNVDFAQQVLSPIQADSTTKAQAWEAYHNASSINDFQNKVASLNLPQTAKADLWEGVNMRFNGSSSAPSAAKPAPMQQVSVGNGAPTASYQAVPDEQTQAGHDAAINQRESQVPAVGQIGIGAAKGAGETVENTVGRLIPGQAPTPEELQSTNGYQTAGKVGENIAEFIAGDEALKGLGIVDKLKQVSAAKKLIDLVQASPTIAKIIDSGLSMLRLGTVGTGQGLAHGEDLGTAAKTGAVTGVTGGALEAATGLLGNVISKPVQEVESAQPALRNTISDTVSNSAGTSGAPVTETDPFGFGNASKQVANRSQKVFEKIDDLSDGEFSKAQKEAKLARGSLDYEGKKAYQAALDKQNDIFDSVKGKIKDGDLNQAKTDWKKSVGLDELNSRFQKTVHATPVELAKAGNSADLGYVNGKAFREAITDSIQNGEFDKAGFSPQHIQSLKDLGISLENGNAALKLNPVLQGLEVIGFAHGLGGVFKVGKVAGMILKNPRAVGVLTKGLRVNQAVPALINSLQLELLRPTHYYDPDKGLVAAGQ